NNENVPKRGMEITSIHTLSSRRKHFLGAKQLFIEDQRGHR
ncbi:uncharacterized protein METZ01_LOCUS343289, partial [marine metagenome]